VNTHFLTGTLQEPPTSEEKKFYGSIFKTLDPAKTGKISGLAAKPLLEASGLPLASLGEIWNFADPDNTGFLDQRGFFSAMRMISDVQSGNQLTPDAVQHVKPLAKFHTIPISSTGTGSMSIQGTGSNGMSPRGSRVPSTTSSIASNTRLIVPLLAPDQASKFGIMFDRTVSSPNGILSGVQARDIFLKARLPVQVLEKIWNLVDRQQRGELSRPEFIMAMHLIQSFLGKTMTVLPTVLPEAMWKTAEDSKATPPAVPSPRVTSNANMSVSVSSPQPSAHSSQPSSPASASSTDLNTWIMSLQQRQQYGALFDSLDKNKTGTLSGSQVASFLMTSNLPNDVLASIWELANLNNSDGFNRQEFCIAMYLVQKKLAGYNLPEKTPDELRESSQSSILQPPAPAQAQRTVPESRIASSASSSRGKSHMDDLKDIFGLETAAASNSKSASQSQTTPSTDTPVAPLQTSRTGTTFVPSSNFGRQLQKEQIEKEQQAKNAALEETNDTTSSSDEDEGPEDLDKPNYPPVIPERNSKPVFSSTDLSDQVQAGNAQNAGFSNQPTGFSDQLTGFSNQPTGFSNQPTGFSNQPAGFSSQPAGVTDASTAFADHGAEANVQPDAVKTQLSKATVDIANFSNEVNSLSRQNANLNSRKDKAQKELAKVLKVREDIKAKLAKLKTFYQSESETMQQKSKELVDVTKENNQLQQELSIVEANHHSEQAKLSNLQQELDKALNDSKLMKERLSSLNTEYQQFQEQNKSLEVREKQERSKAAVIRRQVESQQASNTQLKDQIQHLTESIKLLVSGQSKLADEYNKLEDESLDLHDEHTTLSAEYVEKNLSSPHTYSTTEPKNEDKAAETEISDKNNEEKKEKDINVKYPKIEDTNEAEEVAKSQNEDESLEKSVDEPKEAAKVPEEEENANNLADTEKKRAEKEPSLEEQNMKNIENDISSEKTGIEQSTNEKSINKSEPESEPAEQAPRKLDEEKNSISHTEPFGSVAKRASQQTVSDDDSYEVLNREDAMIASVPDVKPYASLNISKPEEDENKDKEEEEVHENKQKEEEEERKEEKKEEKSNSVGLTDDATATASVKQNDGKLSFADSKLVSATENDTHEASTTDASQVLEEKESKEGEQMTKDDKEKEPEPAAGNCDDDDDDDDDNDNGSFKPLKEHHISDSESSSSNDQFEDSFSSPVAPVINEKKTILDKTDAVKPTNNENTSAVDASPKKSTNPFYQATNDTMFDDLGLEEAVPETSEANEFDELDQRADQFTDPVGFSFTEASATPTATAANNDAGADDWEQVFAGFGNDPKLTIPPNDELQKNSNSQEFTSTPSGFTSTPSGFTSSPPGFTSVPAAEDANTNSLVEDEKKQEEKASDDLSQKYTQAQSLAIDELIGMGFDENKSIDALKKKSWNLDDATNYLLDNS